MTVLHRRRHFFAWMLLTPLLAALLTFAVTAQRQRLAALAVQPNMVLPATGERLP